MLTLHCPVCHILHTLSWSSCPGCIALPCIAWPGFCCIPCTAYPDMPAMHSLHCFAHMTVSAPPTQPCLALPALRCRPCLPCLPCPTNLACIAGPWGPARLTLPAYSFGPHILGPPSCGRTIHSYIFTELSSPRRTPPAHVSNSLFGPMYFCAPSNCRLTHSPTRPRPLFTFICKSANKFLYSRCI